MKRIIPFIALFSLLLMQGCGDDAQPAQQLVRPVKTIVVDEGGVGRLWTFAGTAEDALQSDLSFRVGGKIILFPGDKIGRKFSEGEVIARLDPADYELELRQARANMEQVRANYVRAKADMDRNAQLFERTVISRGELDKVEAEFKSFQAQLSASTKKLDIARKHLAYTSLTAPFDGWIGSVKANIHQNVASGTPVVSFNAGRQMKMYIAVPDMLISQVSEGDDVEVRFDALPGQTMRGKIMEVSVDSASGSTYPVKVHLDNTDKLVRSGMSGHVSFMDKAGNVQHYFLPAVAVTGQSDGTRSIWVVDPKTSTVVNRPVTVGKLTTRGLEIVEGIAPGDRVVIRGVHHLKEGLKVRYTKSATEG